MNPSDNMRSLLLKDAYESSIIGSKPPNAMVVSGALLNSTLLTDQYAADKSYLVIRDAATGRVSVSEQE